MPNSNQYISAITGDLFVTIANGASLSDSIDLSGTTLCGYIMPASWTTADITFQASIDGTNFFDLYDQYGTEVKHTVSTNRFIALLPSDNTSIRYIKFRSGISSGSVSQGAQRQITLVTRAI